MYSVYTYIASYINCQFALAYSVHHLYNVMCTVVAVVLTVHNLYMHTYAVYTYPHLCSSSR